MAGFGHGSFGGTPTSAGPKSLRISVVNLLPSLSLSTFTSENAIYPVSNLKTPERALKVWKSLDLGGQQFTWDFITPPAVPFGLLFIVNNTNTQTITFAGNTTNSFPAGATPFYRIINVYEDPVTGRRACGLWIKTWTWRWMRVIIDPQTPTDGQAVYQLGGIHCGPCLDVPQGVLKEGFSIGPKKPRRFDEAASGAFEEYADLGPARTQLTLTRRSAINRQYPGVSDNLSKWLAVDRQWGGAPAAVLLNNDSNQYAWIMRNMADLDWPIANSASARNTLSLVETLGP